MEGRVVVIVSLAVFQHDERGIFAARFRELGLTSYGYSIPAAEESLKRLFNTFVRSHREMGRLEERLNEMDVEWHWEEEYSDPYEDTSDTVPALEEDLDGWRSIAAWTGSSAAVDALPLRMAA